MFTLNKKHNKLWKLFETEKAINKNDFKDLIKRSEKEGRHLAEMFFHNDKIDNDVLLELLAKYYNVPSVSLRGKIISPQVINLVPKEISQQHSFVIFKKIRETVYVATTAPDNQLIIEFIRKKTGFEPEIFITTPGDLNYALTKYKQDIGNDFSNMLDKSTQDSLAANVPLEKMVDFIPVIQMVNSIIEKAILSNASDIHIEPSAEKITIRFRIDGLLYRIAELPRPILPMIVARIKIIANLKIDEHMIPQDGRFQYDFDGEPTALRVSIIPTLHGQKVVMRILEMKQKMLTMQKLGLNKIHYNILEGTHFFRHILHGPFDTADYTKQAAS